MLYQSAMLILTVLLSQARAKSSAGNMYSGKQYGEATWYGYSGQGGNCGIDSLPSWVNSSMTYLVALNNNQYMSGDQSSGCGTCLKGEYRGSGSGSTPPAKSFTAYVVDRCPECAPGDLDLGKSGDGRFDISWTSTPCPVGNQNIQWEFEGSNAWYLKVGVRNHRCAVDRLEIQHEGVWRNATRTQDNFFMCTGSCKPGGAFQMPLHVRAVSAFGEVAWDEIPYINTKNNSPMWGNWKPQFWKC